MSLKATENQIWKNYVKGFLFNWVYKFISVYGVDFLHLKHMAYTKTTHFSLFIFCSILQLQEQLLEVSSNHSTKQYILQRYCNLVYQHRMYSTVTQW